MHSLEKENTVQTLKNKGKSVRKNPKNTEEKGTPGALGDILLQPMSFGGDHDGLDISLELMERITPEQIVTLHHVEESNLGQVDISWSAATCGETMLEKLYPKGPQPMVWTLAGTRKKYKEKGVV